MAVTATVARKDTQFVWEGKDKRGHKVRGKALAANEAALRAARSEIYQAQEQAFKELQEHVAAQVAETRAQSDAALKQARAELAQEVEAAKGGLAQDSEALANQIAESILRRRAA